MGDPLKKKCGPIYFSSCILYTGDNLTFVKPEDQVKCTDTINDVLKIYDKYMKTLVDGNDLTGLDKNCLDFDPATITVKGLHQVEIDEICVLKGQITSINTQLADLNIENEIITIDLGCMTADAAPCAEGVNQYTLISILQMFKSKICDHETRISNLES